MTFCYEELWDLISKASNHRKYQLVNLIGKVDFKAKLSSSPEILSKKVPHEIKMQSESSISFWTF